MAESNIDKAVEGCKELSLRGQHMKSQPTIKTEDLSPRSQNYLECLVQSISKKEAVLDHDGQGRLVIRYLDRKEIPVPLCHVDKSEAHTVQTPKTDEDMSKRINALLEVIEYDKANRAPSGVVRDTTQITAKSKKYRLGVEFEKTGEILGKGNVAGEIIVVRDKGTGKTHALKSVMISEFRGDELRCWVGLEESGICPCLYLIRREDNFIHLHMEELKQAITLKDILDNYSMDKSVHQPFCLYIYRGLLRAVETMHSKNWCHRDLHPGNVMLQKDGSTINIKILDFGKANIINDAKMGIDSAGREDDIIQTIRLFSALYIGNMFESALDLKKNYKILTDYLEFDDRVELLQLVEMALEMKIKESIAEIDNKLKKENVDKMIRKAVAILFKESEYTDLHTDGDLHSKGSGYDYVDSSETLEQRAANIPADFIRSLRDSWTIKPH